MEFTNYIADGLFLLFGIITIIVCAKRGFILTLLKFFKLILSVAAAYLWGDALGSFLGEKFLNQPIRDAVFNRFNTIYQGATEGFNAATVLENIPEFLKSDALTDKLNGIQGAGMDLVNSFTDTVAGALSSVVCAILGYVLVFVAAFLVLSIVYLIIKGIKDKIRLVGKLDSLLGALLGLALSWVVLLVAGSAMKYFFGDEAVYTESLLVKFFGESSLLETIQWLNVDQWLNKIHELGI
ncbi:MAG: hypothetical protein E7620_07210 [Ruminococcaceae bacterium]|nr:hypothetical protein [Oscillospiraceae bacterium]